MTTANINLNNLITFGYGKVYEVETTIDFTLASNFPYNNIGKVYKLGEHDMSVFNDTQNDSVELLANGREYIIPTSNYQFKTLKNPKTATLTMNLLIKVHADTAEQAFERVKEILADGDAIEDFAIYDFEIEEDYYCTVLSYNVRDTYQAKPLKHDVYFVDTSVKGLKQASDRELYTMFDNYFDTLVTSLPDDVAEELDHCAMVAYGAIHELALRYGLRKEFKYEPKQVDITDEELESLF